MTSQHSVECLSLEAIEKECKGKSPVMAAEHFFEGAEKLLELWFDKDQPGATSLRKIPYAELVSMLAKADCLILHTQINEYMDSYVLSESSMFISDNRIILKTCGTTKLLNALYSVLNLAHEYAGMDNVLNVFYSRKNFMRPENQPVQYHSFDREVDYLDRFFNDGAAYCMGSLKQDRWFLYTMSTPHGPLPYADHTLEILMTELPTEVLGIFNRSACKDGKDCRKKSGIDCIVPFDTEIIEELFDPCGYSMNGVLRNTDQYITIHITPEPEFSFASFETNENSICLYMKTRNVIDLFKPDKFIVTVFANNLSMKGKKAQKAIWNCGIPGYKKTNLQFLGLQQDTLVYAQFVKRKCSTLKTVLVKRTIVEGDGLNE